MALNGKASAAKQDYDIVQPASHFDKLNDLATPLTRLSVGDFKRRACYKDER